MDKIRKFQDPGKGKVTNLERRCECGRLLAKHPPQIEIGIEIKCRKCKRLVLITTGKNERIACDCGNLLAKGIGSEIVEIKCRKCKRLEIVKLG